MEKQVQDAPSARSDESKAPAAWAEDWSSPEKLPRMSAAIPLFWMAVLFTLCVAWGYLYA